MYIIHGFCKMPKLQLIIWNGFPSRKGQWCLKCVHAATLLHGHPFNNTDPLLGESAGNLVDFLCKRPLMWRFVVNTQNRVHYCNDVIMGSMASQIASLTIVYSIVYSRADQRIHQSSASLAFVRGIHQWPVNSPHKWPVTRKMFPFNDVIMLSSTWTGRPQITRCAHDIHPLSHSRDMGSLLCVFHLFWRKFAAS